MDKTEFKYIIVASHRRSGTHWLIDTLFNNFRDIKHGYLNLDRIIPEHEKHLGRSEFIKELGKAKKKMILKTHTPGDFDLFSPLKEERDIVQEQILPHSKIIYIYRDCRDVFLSLYFYLLISPNFQCELFKKFLEEPHDLDNIDFDLNRVQFYKYHVESWIKQSNVFFVKYEDLHFSKSSVLQKLEEFLGIEIRTDPVEINLKKYNILQRGLRRIIPQLFKSTAVLPRSGKVGEWKKDYDVSVTNIINKYCGSLLRTLGYERDDDQKTD